MKRPLRDALGSTKPVESHQIKTIKLPKVTAYENAEYENPNSKAKGVLVLTVDQEPDWDDCLTGLAMLCKYDQEGTRYRKVTVLGLKERKTTTKVTTLLDLASREIEVTDKGVEQLRQGFEKLAACPLSAQRPLLMKLLLESFKKHFPAKGKPQKKDLDLKLEDILPTKHAKPKHEERIVMPERYDLEDFNRIAQAMFAGDGDIRKLTTGETSAEQTTSEEAN